MNSVRYEILLSSIYSVCMWINWLCAFLMLESLKNTVAFLRHILHARALSRPAVSSSLLFLSFRFLSLSSIVSFQYNHGYNHWRLSSSKGKQEVIFVINCVFWLSTFSFDSVCVCFFYREYTHNKVVKFIEYKSNKK